jgi:hypothetical protein
LTPYEVNVSASSDHASQAGYPLQLPSGLPNEMVKVVGRDGPPDVTITGPGGVTASTAGQTTSVQQAPFVIRHDDRLNTTYIAIIHPPAGRYVISTNEGSPAIAQILTAHGFTPTIQAHVTGTGRHRRLLYSINSQPGETVSFIERGRGVDRLIGNTTQSTGTLEFKVAPGPGGIRQIVAIGTENGQPLVLQPGTATPGQLIVASYRAPGPTILGHVRQLRANRTGNHLLVSFDRVPGAKKYVVLAALRDGLRTDVVTSSHSLRLSVPTVGSLGGSVTARALGDNLTTSNGPIITVSIKVPKPPKRSRRPPNPHHGRHHR